MAKEVEVTIEDKKHKFMVRRLTFGEKNDLEEACLDTKIVGRSPMAKVNTKRLKELAILKSVKSETYPLTTEADIQKLPSDVGEALWRAYLGENEQNFQEDSESNTQ